MATTDASSPGRVRDTRQRIYEYVAREEPVSREAVRATVRRRPASASKPSRSGVDRTRGTEPLRPSELQRHLEALESAGRIERGDDGVQLAE
jgi:plasmid stabilization system protein ParE